MSGSVLRTLDFELQCLVLYCVLLIPNYSFLVLYCVLLIPNYRFLVLNCESGFSTTVLVLICGQQPQSPNNTDSSLELWTVVLGCRLEWS